MQTVLLLPDLVSCLQMRPEMHKSINLHSFFINLSFISCLSWGPRSERGKVSPCLQYTARGKHVACDQHSRQTQNPKPLFLETFEQGPGLSRSLSGLLFWSVFDPSIRNHFIHRGDGKWGRSYSITSWELGSKHPNMKKGFIVFPPIWADFTSQTNQHPHIPVAHAKIFTVHWRDRGMALLMKRHRPPKSRKTILNHFVILI